MAESKTVFYEGTQEEYNNSSKDENGIYFITDTQAIYKGSVKYSGESEIATPASPGVIKPGESFEVSSDGTLNLVGVPNELFTPVKQELKTEINKAISESGHLKRAIVDELPVSGADNIIYMKSKSEEEGNIYDEYMWINRKWERIGSSEVDLSNYATKQSLQEAIVRTLTEANTYTDQEKNKYVPLTGNVSISNQITINAEPSSEKHIATKQYVDDVNISMAEAENRRETNEGMREASEVRRESAESQRALAESERVSSEEARRAAETARVAAESAREVAENNRSQTFSNNLISWEEQVSAETTKAGQASEEARRAAETANTAVGKVNETLGKLPIHADNILRGSATGVIAHADDVYPSTALGFNIYGNSKQYTTTGANKFNPAEIQDGSANGITWTKNEDGSITVSGTSTALVNINLVANPSEFILSVGKWTGSVKGANKAKLIVQTLDGTQICNTNTSATRENKMEQGLEYFMLQIQAQTTLNETIFVYLEKSDKALYEEYTDGKPSPRPDFPRDITNVKSANIGICGKNLFGRFETRTVNGVTFSQESDGTVVVKGTPTKPYTNMRYSLDRSVFGQAVTVTCAGNVGNGASDAGAVYPQITIENAMGANTNAGLYANMEKLTMDIPSDARGASIIISCGEDTTQARDARLKVMVAIGRSAEDYEPHTSASFPIDLQGNELCSLPNDVRDEIRIDKEGNVELVQHIEKITVDSVDNMSNSTYQYTCIKPARPAFPGNSKSIVSNRFSVPYLSVGSGDNPDILLCFDANTFESQEAMNQWFEANPTDVYYQMKEPIITSLGKIDMPTLPAPIANAWANSENPTDVKFSYIRDVNIAYEKLASALASAMNTPTTIPELEL